MTKVVKHIIVGEEIDSVEWASDEMHELPTDSILVISNPPVGKKRVVNIYFDPDLGLSGKYVIEREE